ncbi:unnamed protein product [Symbiodinium natans]|uniref:Uncharacterized protein n=1 Tax=Symbiodinium natans TaxID=878477 RepID=A0A812U7V7_9DINO|nr:unnamed protein product [Symbiodinium natans]
MAAVRSDDTLAAHRALAECSWYWLVVFLFGGSYTLLGLGDMRLYAMLAADVVLFSLALCINGIASLLILE